MLAPIKFGTWLARRLFAEACQSPRYQQEFLGLYAGSSMGNYRKPFTLGMAAGLACVAITAHAADGHETTRATQDIAKRVLTAFAKDYVKGRWHMYVQHVCTDENYRKSIVKWAATTGHADADAVSSLNIRIVKYLECQSTIATAQPAIENADDRPQAVAQNPEPVSSTLPVQERPISTFIGYSIVNRTKANLRLGPGTEYLPVDRAFFLKQGVIVRVIRNADNGWQEVEAPGPDGKPIRGFVNRDLLTPSTEQGTITTSTSTSPSSPLSQAVGPAAAPSPPIQEAIVMPPAPVATSSVTVKCTHAVGYAAPDGNEWDGRTTVDLQGGDVINAAVQHTQAKDNARFYKGQFGGQTVFVRQSDIDGSNCDGTKSTTERTPSDVTQPSATASQQLSYQCPPGTISGQHGLCFDRYGRQFQRVPVSNQLANQCPPGSTPGLFGGCIGRIRTPSGTIYCIVGLNC